MNKQNEMYGFVYVTTNKLNGKKYIGKRSFGCGWKSYLGSGKLLKLAIIKYGKENFEKVIITSAKNKEELSILEKYYIKLHNAVESDMYYNLESGGQGNGLVGENSPLFGKEPANVNRRTVICEDLKTGKTTEFENITKFSKENGFLSSKICTILKNNKGSHKKCIFYYKDDFENKSAVYYSFKNIIEEDLFTGEKIIIDNISKYCVDSGISKSSIYGCINGKYYQSKNKIYYYDGDTPNIKIKDKNRFIAIHEESGVEYYFDNVDEFCNEHKLTYQRVYSCLNGSQKSGKTKGYIIKNNDDNYDNPEPS